MICSSRNFSISQFVLGFLLLVGSMFMLECEPTKQEKARLQELESMAAKTPTFPDFEQVDSFTSVKSERAIVTYFYRSSASYEEVKAFYTRVLLAEGWQHPEEEDVTEWGMETVGKRVIFSKGQYTIHLEYARDKYSEWRFALDYIWDAKPFPWR